MAFPVAWAVAGIGAALTHGRLIELWPSLPDTAVVTGLVTVALGILGGLVAVRYSRLAQETVRSVRVRLTRARRRISIARLKVERAELFDAVIAMAEGLELPGRVDAAGRIVRDDSGPTVT